MKFKDLSIYFKFMLTFIVLVMIPSHIGIKQNHMNLLERFFLLTTDFLWMRKNENGENKKYLHNKKE